MSKSLGSKIAIKFTDDLIGDVTGNENAFKVTGKEYKYVKGPLIDKNYIIDKVERHGAMLLHKENFTTGGLNNVVINNSGFIELEVVE